MADLSSETLENFEFSSSEINQIGEALKSDEFRKLLGDYAKEITDPESQKQYQAEITELEKERGNDVTFINPKPGYVIKTSVDGSKKCFLNICSNDNVAKPTLSRTRSDEGHLGQKWSIPHLLAPPHDDLDKKNIRCVVYDIIFHPDTIQMALDNKQLYNIVNQSACDSVESKFQVKLDKLNLKFPKISYKGIARPTVIRKKIEGFVPTEGLENFFPKENLNEEFESNSQLKSPKSTKMSNANNTLKNSTSTDFTIPKYAIKYRKNIDMQEFTENSTSKQHASIPNEIDVEIDLPLLNSTNDCVLDVGEKHLTFKSDKGAKYKLELTLPYQVSEISGSAKFDQTKRKLLISLPVVKKNILLSCDSKDDSGVEFDLSSPASSPASDVGFDELNSADLGQENHEVPRKSLIQEVVKEKEFNLIDLNVNNHENLKEPLIKEVLNEKTKPEELNSTDTMVSKDIIKPKDLNSVDLLLDNLEFSKKSEVQEVLNQNDVAMNHNGTIVDVSEQINSEKLIQPNQVKSYNLDKYTHSLSTFLNHDISYTQPEFVCHKYAENLAFTLQVKNMESDSLKKLIFPEGVYLKFSTVSSGYFPINYALLITFPPKAIDSESVNIEVWENNVILELKLFEENLTSYKAGLDLNNLKDYFLNDVNILPVEKNSNNLEIGYNYNEKEDEVCINIKKVNSKFQCSKVETSDEVSKPTEMAKKDDLNQDGGKTSQNLVKTSSKNKNIPENGLSKKKHAERKKYCRFNSLSESSGDELSFGSLGRSPSKGILKRYGRSISESSVDEACFSTSVDNYILSDSYTQEEKFQNGEGSYSKKTVRFDDNIQHQVFSNEDPWDLQAAG